MSTVSSFAQEDQNAFDQQVPGRASIRASKGGQPMAITTRIPAGKPALSSIGFGNPGSGRIHLRFIFRITREAGMLFFRISGRLPSRNSELASNRKRQIFELQPILALNPSSIVRRPALSCLTGMFAFRC
jgi:hypothetical protein